MISGKRIFIAAGSVIAAAAIAAAGVLLYYDFSARRVDLRMYFLDEEGTGIVSELHSIRYKNEYDLVSEIIDELKSGPDDSKLGDILPRNAEVQNISFSDDESVEVDFSGAYLTSDPSRNVLNTYAVTKSICASGTVKRVMITVNGGEITDQDGNRLGYVTGADINLENEEYSSEMRDVVLYFATGAGDALAREVRTITITDQQPIEQYIINELIKGPNDESMRSVLSDDTVLVSVDVEDNICYLNFRSSFLTQNSGDETHEKLVVYSIVNSLTELNTINRVQFLMDGKRVDSFGSIDIHGYVSRDMTIIGGSGSAGGGMRTNA